MKKGMLSIVDGLSGSGKSTVVHGIAKLLFEKSRYEDVLITREPADNVHGRKARALRKYHKEQGIPTSEHAQEYSDLYFQSGLEHADGVFRPSIDRGIHVVCDRLTTITQLAYQRREGIPLDYLLSKRQHAGFIRPDIVLIMDLPPEEAYQRIIRSGRTLSALERVDIMTVLRQYFLEIPKLIPDEPIHIINAHQDAAGVLAEIELHIDRCWNEKYSRKP